MKRKLLPLLLLLLFVCAGSAFAAPPEIISETACLMDGETGQILFQKDMDAQRSPASITKLMTALLVFEQCDMDDRVTVTKSALDTVDPQSSRVGFAEGEELSVYDLMNAMLIYSANDAAHILAEHCAGSVAAFAEQMTERAKELGCTSTKFVTPSGLDEDGHLTTAHDMALIARALYDYPEFFTIASRTKWRLDPDNVFPEGCEVYSHDKILIEDSEFYNPDVTAAKTGWTTLAQNTFVVYGERDGVKLIAVLMKSSAAADKYNDATALLNYGFTAYDKITLDGSELYRAAETAALHADDAVTLTENALDGQQLTLRLPKGMTADSLDYVCYNTGDTTALLSVLVNEESEEALTKATGLTRDTALATLSLTVEDASLTQPVSNDIDNAVDDAGLPQIFKPLTKGALLILSLVLIAVVFLLVVGWCIRHIILYRRKKKRKKTGSKK
ncbi:MAG: D-alanyl-D-alanine carboxypeptidase family protein [Butyricicoccaceae bacterium]